MLTHMQLAGCFEGLAGIVLGSFEDCGSMEDVISIVAHAFADKPLPILAGLDAGHGKNNMTLPFGILATLDADGHCLSYQQTGTLGRQTTEDR
jgi:muramoyltetrapeptide carboxypeptidase